MQWRLSSIAFAASDLPTPRLTKPLVADRSGGDRLRHRHPTTCIGSDQAKGGIPSGQRPWRCLSLLRRRREGVVRVCMSVDGAFRCRHRPRWPRNAANRGRHRQATGAGLQRMFVRDRDISREASHVFLVVWANGVISRVRDIIVGVEIVFENKNTWHRNPYCPICH